MHIGKVKAYLCQKQPPATTPNVKAEMVLFLSTPEIRMPVHSLLPRGVCGPVCKLTVWAVWPCPLTIPSPGRKIWVHHHWCIGAAPSHKGGVLLLRLLFQACYLDHFFLLYVVLQRQHPSSLLQEVFMSGLSQLPSTPKKQLLWYLIHPEMLLTWRERACGAAHS